MSWFDKIGESLKRFSEHVKTGAENIRENIRGGFEDARDLGERSAFNLKEGHIGTAIGEKVLHDTAVLGNIASLGAAHGIGQKLADSSKLDLVADKVTGKDAPVFETTVGLGGVAGLGAGAAFAAAQNLDTTVKASQDKDTGKAARGSEFDYIQKSADGVSVELGGE